MSQLESNDGRIKELEINDEFLGKITMSLLRKIMPWYADLTNYIVYRALPND